MTNNAWPIVEVEPARLRCGLWGYEEGDIHRSYSADCFGEKRKVRRAFQHGLQHFIAMNTAGDNLHHAEARAYPIRPAHDREKILQSLEQSGEHDGYAGKEFTHRGQGCVFGLPVIFRRRALSSEETCELARRMFAYGGWFASNAGTYQRFVAETLEKSLEPNIKEALLIEMTNNTLPQTQEAMRELIETERIELPLQQLTLF